MASTIDRKEVIILDVHIVCKCGRTKERAHCPVCGKIKLYGLAETCPAISEETLIPNCKMYRCAGCGEKFNDVDWYFNCNAPVKVDLAIQRRLAKEKLIMSWRRRMDSGEHFDYNMRAKCRAEAGFDPVIERANLAKALVEANKPAIKTKESLTEDILNIQAWLNDHLKNCAACATDAPCESRTNAILEINKHKNELKELDNEQPTTS